MLIISQFALLLLIAIILALIVRMLKQPLIVGYILTGIIAGPFVLDVIHSTQELEMFAHIGIVFLLFIVGLHLNPKVIKEVGKVSLITGIGQIVFTSLIGFGIALTLGLSRIMALYVAIALTFSSTIIILKLISDKGDLEKLYAKIAVGFLLVQDVVATIILIAVAFMADASTGSFDILVSMLLKSLGVFGTLILLAIFVIPRLTKQISQNQEILFLFSTSWALGLASLMADIGLSIEIGALVAGVSLASTPYAEEMASRLKPIRDLFILIFFILLGASIQLNIILPLIVPAIILSTFVLFGNPVIVLILMKLLGYKKKIGFYAGLTVAQISEFSLILAALGLQIGHLSPEVVSLITLVGLITIAGSTYLILYADDVYALFNTMLIKLGLVRSQRSEIDDRDNNVKVIIFGYNRIGRKLIKVFKTMKKPFLVAEYNPETIAELKEKNIPCVYGDASDVDFLDELPFDNLTMCLSTIPDLMTNQLIQQHLNRVNHTCLSILVADDHMTAKQLYHEGASYVIMPRHLGGDYAARMIKRFGLKKTPYKKSREKYLSSLIKR